MSKCVDICDYNQYEYSQTIPCCYVFMFDIVFSVEVVQTFSYLESHEDQLFSIQHLRNVNIECDR